MWTVVEIILKNICKIEGHSTESFCFFSFAQFQKHMGKRKPPDHPSGAFLCSAVFQKMWKLSLIDGFSSQQQVSCQIRNTQIALLDIHERSWAYTSQLLTHSFISSLFNDKHQRDTQEKTSTYKRKTKKVNLTWDLWVSV